MAIAKNPSKMTFEEKAFWLEESGLEELGPGIYGRPIPMEERQLTEESIEEICQFLEGLGLVHEVIEYRRLAYRILEEFEESERERKHG